MTTEAVSCSHCGAPLEVDVGRDRVVCQFCGAELIVRRTADVTYTEQVQQLQQRAERLAGEMEVVRLRDTLDRLDREWAAEVKNRWSADAVGELQGPRLSGTVPGLALAAFGTLWVAGVQSMGAGGGAALFGAPFLLLGVGWSAVAAWNCAQFGAARRRYERQRSELTRRLRQAEQEGEGLRE